MRLGVQGWCSGEDTCLPRMWPGLDSQTWHHMWVECFGFSTLLREVFLQYSGFLLSSKTNV